jgi:hypothetical protein
VGGSVWEGDFPEVGEVAGFVLLEVDAGSPKDIEQGHLNAIRRSDCLYDIRRMVRIRGFDNETPRDVVLLLVEEVGELARRCESGPGNSVAKRCSSTSTMTLS